MIVNIFEEIRGCTINHNVFSNILTSLVICGKVLDFRVSRIRKNHVYFLCKVHIYVEIFIIFSLNTGKSRKLSIIIQISRRTSQLPGRLLFFVLEIASLTKHKYKWYIIISLWYVFRDLLNSCPPPPSHKGLIAPLWRYFNAIIYIQLSNI